MAFGALKLDVTGNGADCDEFAAIFEIENTSGSSDHVGPGQRGKQRREIDRTRSNLVPLPSDFLSEPGATGEAASTGSRRRLEGEPDDEDPTAVRAQDQRVTLLARKYIEGHFSGEEDARLRILTERLRRLIPRVTAGDLEAIESIAVEVDRAGEQNQAIRRSLGLDD